MIESNETIMLLWTWQNPEFSLTDPDQEVESREKSDYYRDNPKAFEELWLRLETDQLLWCYTKEDEAKSKDSRCEYRGKVLWELKVPKDVVWSIICSVAWNLVRSGGAVIPPKSLSDSWVCEGWKRPSRLHQIKDELEKEFRDFWIAKKHDDQLWGSMFLDKAILMDESRFVYDTIQGCTQVVIKHPIEQVLGVEMRRLTMQDIAN